MDLQQLVASISSFLWGPIMLAFLVGTGIFLTIRLKFRPFLNLWYAIKLVVISNESKEGDITAFQAFMISLSATVGTGNIVGVATAMVLGGPGALVWMCFSALCGFATKYAESVLSVKYRQKNSIGEMAGGPMYVMKYGIGGVVGTFLGGFFAISALMASFGIGNMAQANSIAQAFTTSFAIDPSLICAALVLLCLAILMRGVKTIGVVSSLVVPVMALFYVIVSIIAIIINFHALPEGIAEIFRMAFSVEAAAGGVGGAIIASMLDAMRYGAARGVFSNEAGLGSAAIAAAAAKTEHPSMQGYINMTGNFFDTIIICVLTGLVIASSGALGATNAAGEIITGAELTIYAFSSVFGEHARIIVSISLALFAFSTILGWEYYGEKALEYLWDNHDLIVCYRTIFSMVTYIGATQSLTFVWDFSDMANGLMIIPNLISLIILSKVVREDSDDYQVKYIDKK